MSEVGLWHVRQGDQPVRLTQRTLPSEKDLESWIESDPSLIAPGLHSVRCQVPRGTKYMDLLAVESPGVWVVCELKKVALEREVLGG
jgi:RecB family endonuclease NucS